MQRRRKMERNHRRLQELGLVGRGEVRPSACSMLNILSLRVPAAWGRVRQQDIKYCCMLLVVVTLKTIPITPPSTPFFRTDPTDIANSRGHMYCVRILTF